MPRLRARCARGHAAWGGAAAALSLQTIASRETAPAEPFVLSIGSFHAGERYNIIAGRAALEGTVRAAAEEVIEGGQRLLPTTPAMGSEDFAFFSAHAPSAFAFIGCGGDDPLHSGRFSVREAALPTGAALYAQFALNYLNRG